MNSTAIIAILLIGVVLVSGCIGATDNGDTPDGDTATTSEVMGELDQNLINEDSSVEIGDMV